MATMAVEPVFVDTNILVYAHQALSPYHAQATSKLHALHSAGHALWISRQVLREYLAVMSRPGALTSSVPKLLTHNVADFTRFAAQITVNPLVP